MLKRSLGANPSLPTYQSVANFLEKKNGSGIRLLGWTLLRTALIAPPFILVGVHWKKALAGAALASGLISLFTLLRIYNAGPPFFRQLPLTPLGSSRHRRGLPMGTLQRKRFPMGLQKGKGR